MSAGGQGERAGSGGFTLVELLVAMGVFGLLMLGLAQVVATVERTVRAGAGLADADAEARTLGALLERDLQRRVMGRGLPVFAKIDPWEDGEPEDDSFGILTRAPGYGGDRGLTWVQYRLKDGKMERGSRGFRFGEKVGWEGADDILQVGMEAPVLDEEEYDVVSGRVIRFELGLVGWDETEGEANWVGAVGDAAAGASLSIYFAVLGDEGAALLDEDGIAAVKGLFRDAELGGASPLPDWRKALEGLIGDGGGGLPVAALQSVRIYQTVVSLH